MTTLDKILAEVDKEKIDTIIRRPCKMAELSYKPIHPTPTTIFELYEDLGAYFNYLNKAYHGQQHVYPDEYAQSMGIKMVSGALQKEGGMRYAIFLAQSETFGAVKQVMTSIFIGQLVSSYIDHVLETHFDPYDYYKRKELVLEYIDKFNIDCTPGMIEEWTNYYAELIKSHVRREEEAKLDREIRIPGRT